MIGRAFIIFVLIFSLSQEVVFAQNDSITYHTSLYFLTANNSFQPHWQVSNRYGIFDDLKQSEFVGLFGLGYKKYFGTKFKAETEVEFNLKSELSNSYFQQLYFNLFYGALQLKIGKEAYTIGQYSDDLSSGSLFLSNNSIPLPRIGMGFYDYTPMPFIGKFIEFKGALNFGILNDDRGSLGNVENPWFHEKFFYLKSRTLPVNVHAGINHNAIFGGTTSDGRKIESDLLSTFFARGSSKVGGGEENNVAGAHFGLYDVGLSWKIKQVNFQTYFQKPFSDGSGMRLNSEDKVIGILLTNAKKSFFHSINYEYINTTHQSGAGIPDPVINGRGIKPSNLEDLDQFMLENFDTITIGITKNMLVSYMEKNLNYGNKYTGRDDHYNNYLYTGGLAYKGRAIGNSLFTTKNRVVAMDVDFDGTYDRVFVNNRIVAHHLAFEGYLSRNIYYRTKLTYTENYGSYAGANKGRYNWASKENPEYYDAYYFKDGLKQAYTFLELNYTPFKNKGAKFTSSIAYDFGEMYQNVGVLFGFHFNGFISLKKK